MKRRLTRAYDHMTMPEHCVTRIEQQLQLKLKTKKTGQYANVVSPAGMGRSSWAAAAAAVCLMLVLSVGGTMLFLQFSENAMKRPAEPVTSFAAAETTQPETPADYYAVVTDLGTKRVEAFAAEVRQNVLDKNWDALADKISYSITIQNQEIREKKKFIEWMELFELDSSFTEAIRNESCTAMFCNWQGICMADGKIWFNEVDGELKLTAVNVEVREEVLHEGQKKQVPMEFAEVLSGNAMKFAGYREMMLLEEYCAALWGEATATSFSVVDMDDDTVCEVVVSAQTAEGMDQGHLVLRKEGTEICAYPFWRGDLYDLKKDGSFSRSSNGPSHGSFRLTFGGEGSCSVAQNPVESDSPLADWYAYPCERADLVLQSCEYVSGTGWSLLPGNAYYHFEGLVLGSMGNDWNLQKEQLLRYGMICVEDEGTVCVFDPDAPGTALYGVLTNENGVVQFSELGYYICTADQEYMAEVRNMLSEEPEYWVEAHLPALGSMGRRVYSPEELVSYFGFTQYSQEVIAERQAAKAVVEKFTAAWLARDEKAMKRYLTDDFREDTRRNGAEYSPTGTPELMTIRDLPHRAEECYVTAEFRDAEQDSWFSVCLDMVKQKDGWKVKSCYFGS